MQKSKIKIAIQNFPAKAGSRLKLNKWREKFLILNFALSFCILIFGFWIFPLFAQQSDELELALDVNANTVALPRIFKPNVNLSGRGLHRDHAWPKELAAPQVLESWQKDIGFNGLYRLQYNLWDIQNLNKDKEVQDRLTAHYEEIIKNISDQGGIVILCIFGTPAGLGKTLDVRSAPWDLRAFKELIKRTIKYLSCEKRYNIWYEVWSAPDVEDFFIGRRQEYLSLYRAVAEAVKELEAETKIYIPVGGPSSSWWFQDFDGNNIITPEGSLIYELIRYCCRYHLPLDFITWHGYSTDPKAEKETTTYNKTPVALIRDWLSYFNFSQDTPLIVDEWNYDRGANILLERKEQSHICSSYILSRLKNMSEAGLDYQLYFSLEDFQNNKEGVVRNTGIFWFDTEASSYKGSPKSIYNVFRMLMHLGNDMFTLPKPNDEFVGAIATKNQDYLSMLIYNYIDPEIVRNYLSRNIAGLNGAERKALLNIIKSNRLEKIMSRQLDVSTLRLSKKLKTLLMKAQELNDMAKRFSLEARNIKLSIKNLKENYLYQRYVIDSSCSLNCAFSPIEEKEIASTDPYQEVLSLSPYSVNLVVLKKKPREQEPKTETNPVLPVTGDVNNTSH